MRISEQRIEIALSKKKLLLMVTGSLIFVVSGILFVLNPAKYTSSIFREPTIIFIGGLASLLFFGFCLFSLIKKLFDTSSGLVISDEGILDNSSGVSAGLISWGDIKDISVIKLYRQKLIMIKVKNPKFYIDRQNSGFKRKVMTMNFEKYGTPLSITSNGLQISFDNLLLTLKRELNSSRNK